jgi:hypothetical protein
MDAKIKHNDQYGTLTLYEDYLAVCKGNPCQALLLSILEGKMKNAPQEFIPLSYAGFHKAMHGIYGRSSIINGLKELEQEHLILTRQYLDGEESAYCYRINYPHLQYLLDTLPSKVEVKNILRVFSSMSTLQAQLKILQKFNGKCAYCQYYEATAWDHIIPEIKGGDAALNNLVPVCITCNSSKGSKDVLVWLQQQGLEPSQQLQEMFQSLGITQ